VITPFVGVVETWLPADITLKATDIHERLVAEHGFTGNYQRVKVHLADARPRIAAELAEQDDNPLTGLNRRFRSTPHLPRPLRRSAWPEFIPFLDYDVEIRRVICSTNAIESPNARYRRAVRARGHFPTELAALKCLYLVTRSLDPTGRGRARWVTRWKPALNPLRDHLRRPNHTQHHQLAE